MSNKSSECPVNWNWAIYKVYGKQGKTDENRPKCLAVGSLFPHPWMWPIEKCKWYMYIQHIPPVKPWEVHVYMIAWHCQRILQNTKEELQRLPRNENIGLCGYCSIVIIWFHLFDKNMFITNCRSWYNCMFAVLQLCTSCLQYTIIINLSISIHSLIGHWMWNWWSWWTFSKFSGATVIGLNISDYQVKRAHLLTAAAHLQESVTFMKVWMHTCFYAFVHILNIIQVLFHVSIIVLHHIF